MLQKYVLPKASNHPVVISNVLYDGDGLEPILKQIRLKQITFQFIFMK